VVESLTLDISPRKETGQHQNLMVHVDGGIGYMGTDRQIIRGDGEGPRREITLSPFMIDKYEVSNDGELATMVHITSSIILK